ncbi:zinc finger protein 60-like [Diaphorina citri]|jgi:hypothetical protein|uniref:Zinc finger protein 60-like n=1 Tax=Diaphorina citri TaxID=121845 RepID=A0A1S3CYA9_DIACI|nr:zinc finger protein 60-like [Diaphorina citri]
MILKISVKKSLSTIFKETQEVLNNDSTAPNLFPSTTIICNLCEFKTGTKCEIEEHFKTHESESHVDKRSQKTEEVSNIENLEATEKTPTEQQHQHQQGGSSGELPLLGCCSCSFQTPLISALEEHRNGHLKLNNLLAELKTEVKSVDSHKSDCKKESQNYSLPIIMRPLVCAVCDYKGKDQADFDNHNATIHYYRNLQTESEFPCLFCSYEGRTKTELKTHYYKVHSKDKLFKCHLCQFRTGFQDQLSSHIRSIHTGEKPFDCKVCEFRSASKQGLYYHWKQTGHKIKHAFRQYLPL